MERVDQIALHITKLAHATGITEGDENDATIDSLDGVTSDLDIEALTKGFFDAARDLDQYLMGLLTPDPSNLSSLRQEIQRLEADIATKKRLLDESLSLLEQFEVKLRTLKNKQYLSIYSP